MLTYFDPQPGPGELPRRFPSPFDDAPHPIARRAAREAFDAGAPLREGKMFGVLVCAEPAGAGGRIGYLRAFSGMLDGRWRVPGFVPPAFDGAARDAFWPAGEAGLGVLADRLAALDDASAPARAALAALDRAHALEADALRSEHGSRRDARHRARAALDPSDRDARRALDRESSLDTAAWRAQRAAHRDARAGLAAIVERADAERAAVERERRERSRGLLERLQDTYVLADARGTVRSLRALFAPDEPPGGAGDCAGPKLLAHAYRAGLRPIALAEVWRGPPPLAGGRRAGRFYPACRGKCGPILAHLLGGLDAAPLPVFGAAPPPGPPAIVYEDAWLVVADKPAGLLSVPGRAPELADCLVARLRARDPAHAELRVVHRLDLDTSGLVVAAKDPATFAALQQRFAAREVDKRYLAIVEGAPPADAGVIELALRVDLDDRPRQIHDPIHGKPAVTTWRVVDRLSGNRTLVELAPRTGRTHQLRVHCAHPRGLDAPIAGDRLYGDAASDEMLALRAVELGFVHPALGTPVRFTAPAVPGAPTARPAR